MVGASKSMTRGTYDSWLLRLSRTALDQSRKLLDETAPLVNATEGGSVIGVRGKAKPRKAGQDKPERSSP
ncbi:hypothetical protein [Microvirga calopogonii]|uniref:hypothetical protein n=1 Tax=Microvirga calopogonii TaxID=2078013 RepID=UPI000E0DC207|nr:hypothetical protein [Microvirga calopogonii]